MVTKAAAKKMLQAYGRAWEQQDTALILSLFRKDGTYHERWYRSPFKGHRGIAKYWNDKVVGVESGIRFRLLSHWVINDTVIAEWEGRFHDSTKREDKHIREIGIFELKGGKIKNFREIWQKAK